MASLRAVYAPLQPVFRHRFGIGILVGLQFQPCHNIVCAQPHGVGRLLAVSLLCLFLPFPALALSLDDGDECNVYVRRFLVPMQVRRHDVLLSERVGKVFQIVGAPLVQTSLFLYSLHVLVRSRHVDADCPYLVASDFACQPHFF